MTLQQSLFFFAVSYFARGFSPAAIAIALAVRFPLIYGYLSQIDDYVATAQPHHGLVYLVPYHLLRYGIKVAFMSTLYLAESLAISNRWIGWGINSLFVVGTVQATEDLAFSMLATASPDAEVDHQRLKTLWKGIMRPLITYSHLFFFSHSLAGSLVYLGAGGLSYLMVRGLAEDIKRFQTGEITVLNITKIFPSLASSNARQDDDSFPKGLQRLEELLPGLYRYPWKRIE